MAQKKILLLKLAFAIILAVFSPYVAGLFLNLTPSFLLIIGILSTGIALLFLFWSLKPLSQLIKGTQTFSDGNLNSRIDIRSGDEFERAGNAFNQMAEKLSKTIASLGNDRAIAISERDKFNEILSSVIDGIIALDFNKNVIFLNKSSEELTGYSEAEARNKPIDQLVHMFSETDEILSQTYCRETFNQTAKLIGKMGRQTKINLITTEVENTVQTNLHCILILHDLSREEELEQMKLDFVSMASHELKTPLTSIIGYLSVFLSESREKLPKENLIFLDKAFIAALQLQTLIQNLLNVNKIEKEQLSVSFEPVDFKGIISKAVDDLKPQANQKNIILTLVAPEKIPAILADSVRLGEVATNLLANAINYTPAGGRVEMSVKISPTDVVTSVTDTGIGIPKEAIPHLFGKFFRVSNSSQQGNKGTGLGLFISKSIIEKLHGKIWVESEVGKGSRFSFSLPLPTQTAGILDRNQFTSSVIQSGSLNY